MLPSTLENFAKRTLQGLSDLQILCVSQAYYNNSRRCVPPSVRVIAVPSEEALVN